MLINRLKRSSVTALKMAAEVPQNTLKQLLSAVVLTIVYVLRLQTLIQTEIYKSGLPPSEMDVPRLASMRGCVGSSLAGWATASLWVKGFQSCGSTMARAIGFTSSARGTR